jgi:hypothetical protein
VRDVRAAIAFGGDNRLDTCSGKFRTDGISAVTLVDEQGFDAVSGLPEQWAKALNVVCLTRCQDEAERATWPSQRAWSLVVKPPRDRPSPWVS